MTQESASKELSKFIKCSQSKLCRFEKYGKETRPLETNSKKMKSALINKEIFEKYMLLKNNNINQLAEISDNKKRKKRTNFSIEAVQVLTKFFKDKTHPSIEELEELSGQTKYTFDEIKVWFNNKRQSLKKVPTEQSDD